jgi:hypothetical protein
MQDKGDLDLLADEELVSGPLQYGHSKLENTVSYLGLEVNDVFDIS